MQQLKPNYKFYATLLDSFTRYLNSDSDEALQELLNKINRVPFTSEAAEKGTAFNELVDLLKKVDTGLPENVLLITKRDVEQYYYKGFDFKKHVVDGFVDRYKWAKDQVFAEAILPTSKGNVLVYGFIDEVLPGGLMTDIKCTSKYDFPKYLQNWQHIVYCFCMHENGIPAPYFIYDVTDYSNNYEESYMYNPDKDIPRLVEVCEKLIDFIELQKENITDKKIFALDEVSSLKNNYPKK
ncbi:MAG TPA: HNH endonuclease [Paludibacteraceae bacterium]|nr:HNH endonuclease [Paludibacteraceae bacterium]